MSNVTPRFIHEIRRELHFPGDNRIEEVESIECVPSEIADELLEGLKKAREFVIDGTVLSDMLSAVYENQKARTLISIDAVIAKAEGLSDERT